MPDKTSIKNINDYYRFELPIKRSEQEWRRLFMKNSRLVRKNDKASGGLLVTMLQFCPIKSWSPVERKAFVSLFRGDVRGKHWANIALNYLDDLVVLQIAQEIMNDESRFSDQTEELAKMMVLSVHTNRVAA